MHITALKAVFAGFLLSSSLVAQIGFGVGVKGGVPFTDVLQGTGTIEGQPVTGVTRSGEHLIGPAVEVRLPLGFAFEVDGIYRGADYQVNTATVRANTTTNSWEIPYLAKFRFPIPLLKPFISAGGAYRTFTSIPANTTPTHNAVVAAAGLELRISRFRASAEVRYLHWNGSSVNNVAKLAQNQGELLFGIMF
jgi:hypothetical protein